MAKIVHITAIGGILHAILDNNHAIELSKIKGSPRVGVSLNDDNEVIGNNVDDSCINGVCPIK